MKEKNERKVRLKIKGGSRKWKIKHAKNAKRNFVLNVAEDVNASLVNVNKIK